MKKEFVKVLSGFMSGCLLLNQCVTAFASTEYERNTTGLWITEVYQNDIDRSKAANDKRVADGYDAVHSYSTKDDMMEFVEITNTSDQEINFNDKYELIYTSDKGISKSQTIKDSSGSDNIIIKANETVVFWNNRTDLDSHPTESEFREDMNIPDDVSVYQIISGVNLAANNVTFAIKEKTTGEILSSFKVSPSTDEHTADGLSVQLAIPDYSSNMEVYAHHTLPTPGVVSYQQLNGQRKVNISGETNPKGLFITEIRPNDVNRSGVYGVDDDIMECIEVTNTTDKEINLNDEYTIKYVVKAGFKKDMDLYQSDLKSKDCIIPANSSAVIWCYREKIMNKITAAGKVIPTEADFRSAYKIDDSVPVFLWTNQDGMSNSNRSIEAVKKNGEIVSFYSYNGVDDLKDNRSVDLSVNPEGAGMLVYSTQSVSNMGTVKPDQLSYVVDDGSSIKLELAQEVPSSINQGDELSVQFNIKDSTIPRESMSIYYRFDGQGEWYRDVEKRQNVPSMFFARISADKLFAHKYVEFYVSARNMYRATNTETYRVNINQINDIDGIRMSVSEGENVGGKVTITANNGKDNSTMSMEIDGKDVALKPVLEDGAYYAFSTSGRDSYFKTALATTKNEIIEPISYWRDMNDKAIHIDNQYFSYNEATDTYDVTLRIYSGTNGATFEDIYVPDANRDDFYVSQLRMLLANGKQYLPTKIGPDNAETSNKTNLSTALDASHGVGDTEGWSPYIDASFSIPSSEVTAVGYELDTTKLDDGNHVLKISDGTSVKEVNFIVDNEKPVIDLGINDGAILTGDIKIEPSISDNSKIADYMVFLDDKEIEVPYGISARDLKSGKHTLRASAIDLAGNETSESIEFVVGEMDMNLEDMSTLDISASSAKLSIKLEDKNLEGAKVKFYEGKVLSIENGEISAETKEGDTPYIQYTINAANTSSGDSIAVNWDGTSTKRNDAQAIRMFVQNINDGQWEVIGTADEEGSIKACFEAENHVKDNKATVIVQCTSNGAVPQTNDEEVLKQSKAAQWDGNERPENYDFSFAWITDTQYYAESWQHHNENMNQWIVDNKDEFKIKYVMHTGDIVDEYNIDYQWNNADKAMKIFDDANLPYGVLAGNHDVAAGREINDFYWKYFGKDRFDSKSYYGDSYENNLGHYDLISQNGQDFLMMYMSWNISTEEIEWMNKVLKQYPDRKAIILLHSYTNVKISNDTYLDYAGTMIQNEVVATNPNVMAVLNGHYHGSSYETAKFDDDGDGIKERTVYQICTDYQSGFEGGGEYIKFLYFDLEGDKIYVNSYSPYYNDFNYFDTTVENISEEGKKATDVDAYVLDVDFNTDEQTLTENRFTAAIKTNKELGESNVYEDGNASVVVTGLNENSNYAWYAVAENSLGGELKTDICSFKTKAVTDFSVLESTINEALKYNENDYTSESYKVLKDEIVKANSILNNKDASQSDVDEEIKKLKAAISGLTKKGQLPIGPGNQTNNGTQSQSGNGGNSNIPSTGDYGMPLDTMFTIMIASGLLLGGIFVRKRKYLNGHEEK